MSSPSSSQKLPFPLSLQDMCKLHVLLRLEEFPVETLALLSREIRRKLSLGLSDIDLLHLDGTAFLRDVYEDTEKFFRRQRMRGQLLLGVVFPHNYFDLPSLLSLNLWPVLGCYDQFDFSRGNTYDLLLKHISGCYSSLEPMVIPTLDRYKSSEYTVILPFRSLKYVSLDWSYSFCYLKLASASVEPLLEYCKMETGPEKVRINCCGFVDSSFWKKYQDRLEEEKMQQFSLFGSKPKVDPVIPFVQKYLSSVEVLELTTDELPIPWHVSTMSTVPYLLLYNVVTSKQPRLKHLRVEGNPMLMCYLLDTVAELLCSTTDSPFSFHSGTELATPAPAPYLLEELSVHTYLAGSFENEHANNIAIKTESIIRFQLHNLKCVAVDGLGFCYNFNSDFDDRLFFSQRYLIAEKYRSLLSTLADLLKQPQVHSVSICGRSPLPEAYKLIKTFLCTPATHEQSLTVEGVDHVEDEEEKWDESKEREEEEETVKEANVWSNLMKTKPSWKDEQLTRLSLSQPLPETNAQFKYLNIGHSSSCVHTWLFRIPEIKLKKLKMRTQDINLVPADMNLQVEYVAFSTQFCSYKPTISSVHLGKFIASNLVLKRLELDMYAPGILPALNHCLAKLNKQGRGLEELQLCGVTFEEAGLNEFFAQVRDISQCNGTHLILSQVSESSFSHFKILALSEEFQGKKIKKITCKFSENFLHSDPSSSLGMIADEVVVICN